MLEDLVKLKKEITETSYINDFKDISYTWFNEVHMQNIIAREVKEHESIGRAKNCERKFWDAVMLLGNHHIPFDSLVLKSKMGLFINEDYLNNFSLNDLEYNISDKYIPIDFYLDYYTFNNQIIPISKLPYEAVIEIDNIRRHMVNFVTEYYRMCLWHSKALVNFEIFTNEIKENGYKIIFEDGSECRDINSYIDYIKKCMNNKKGANWYIEANFNENKLIRKR